VGNIDNLFLVYLHPGLEHFVEGVDVAANLSEVIQDSFLDGKFELFVRESGV
jgi:hypothetical protein